MPLNLAFLVTPRIRFQSLDILPLEKYGRLRAYLRERGPALCQLLEPVVCVRMKEDVATALVHITQAENRAAPFLADLVCADVHKKGEFGLYTTVGLRYLMFFLYMLYVCTS